MPNMAAGQISMELGAVGPVTAPCEACAASAMAIGDGYDAIRLGRAEVMLCGGSEAGVTELAIAGFAAMRALSRRNEDPMRASRPFDAHRDGFVMGEGAAVLVLEELEHALARNATVYAEIAGYGVSSDAHHMTEPDPDGAGSARAIRLALADAGLGPEDVDYVNAHASSTPLGDASETAALKVALGEEKAYATPVSALKGATGHCLGAAGAIEACATVLTTARPRWGPGPPPSSATTASRLSRATAGPCNSCSTERPSVAMYDVSRALSAPSAAVHWLGPTPVNSTRRCGAANSRSRSTTLSTAPGTAARSPSSAPSSVASCAARASAPRWLTVNAAERPGSTRSMPSPTPRPPTTATVTA